MATYISNGTGDWTTASIWLTAATGTFTPTATASVAPQSNGRDKIVIRQGHTVTYNTSGVFGDGGGGHTLGTGTKNISTASIILSGGTLRASRTQNTALTAVGTIWVDGASVLTTNSFLDWGTVNDPLSSVTSTISLSCNRDGSAAIYVNRVSTLTLYNSACFCGLEKTRNTFLTSPASASQNQIVVNASKNWANGDLIWIESDTTSTSRAFSARISNVSGNTITLDTNLNFARLAGTRVGNFSSTVTLKSLESSPQAAGLILDGSNGAYQVNNVSFENFGTNWTRTDATGNILAGVGALICTVTYSSITQPIFKGISISLNASTAPAFTSTGLPYNEIIADDIAIIVPSNSTIGSFYFGANNLTKVTNSVIYRCGIGYESAGPYKITFENSYLNAETNILPVGTTGAYNILNNCTLRSNGQLLYFDNLNSWKANNCTLVYPSPRTIATNTLNVFGDMTLLNCTMSVPISSYTFSTVNRTLNEATFNIFNPNNDSTSTSFNYFYHATTNSSIRKNGLTSLSFRPKIPNTAFVKIFTIPAIQGVTQKIKGNLRFDSAYGSTTPPSITFGGAVTTTTFTCQSSVNTWNGFEYDLTPTYTGDIEIRLTGTSTLSTGFVYLDGLNLDPFIKDVRWYGYEVVKNAYRSVDTLTTLTENQVSSVDITNLDRLYDASNYWTINNPLSTSYLDLYTRNGTVLDFGDKNIVVNNSASTNFAYASASNTITIKTPLLSSGNNFNTVKTSGLVTLSGSAILSNITVNANVSSLNVSNLNGVTISKLLSYNTNTPSLVTYTNCTITSATNEGSANVTIKKINSTVTYV